MNSAFNADFVKHQSL